MKRKRRKYNKRKRMMQLRFRVIIAVSLLLVVVVCLLYLLDIPHEFWRMFHMQDNQSSVIIAEPLTESTEVELDEIASADVEPEETQNTENTHEKIVLSKKNLNLQEEDIYAFMQGPVAWASKVPYSGEWCNMEVEGGIFSEFGCGLCDMASIYSTLSPYECSPLDMYYYAQEVSDYAPEGWYGAIDWPYIRDTLQSAGFTCAYYGRDDSFEAFRDAVENSIGAIVLISSENDATYWEGTDGHYVNIWCYNPKTQEVFLGDSGDPAHNRTWIPLEYVYNAYSSSSAYEYLLVTSYEEEKNTWKHSGISEKWVRP